MSRAVPPALKITFQIFFWKMHRLLRLHEIRRKLISVCLKHIGLNEGVSTRALFSLVKVHLEHFDFFSLSFFKFV